MENGRVVFQTTIHGPRVLRHQPAFHACHGGTWINQAETRMASYHGQTYRVLQQRVQRMFDQTLERFVKPAQKSQLREAWMANATFDSPQPYDSQVE
jgi:hypothetical protein